MEFAVSCDEVLSVRFVAEKGKIYFLPNSIFPNAVTRGDTRHMLTKTDNGWYLTVLEENASPYIWVQIPANVKLAYNFVFDQTKEVVCCATHACIKNTLPSGATLEGFLLVSCESRLDLVQEVKVPIKLEKSAQLNVCPVRKELKPIYVVCVDFSSILTGEKHIVTACYDVCVSIVQTKELTRKYRTIGHYYAVGAKPKGEYPCSVKITKEKYGEFDCQKINFVLTLGVHTSFCNKEVSILIKHPSNNKCYTSANHLHGKDGESYSSYQTTFSENKELQQFSGYLIEL